MEIEIVRGTITTVPAEVLVTAANRSLVGGGGVDGVDEPAGELLGAADRAALRRCDEVGARTVAFPSLSTGAFHFPLLEACQISVAALASATTSVHTCTLVAFDLKTERFWRRAMPSW